MRIYMDIGNPDAQLSLLLESRVQKSSTPGFSLFGLGGGSLLSILTTPQFSQTNFFTFKRTDRIRFRLL